MWWMLPAGLAAGGAYQGEQNRQQNKRDAAAQAEVARWSPWTGMSPHQVSHKDSALGGAMQGGLAGMGAIAGKGGGGGAAPTSAEPLATPEQEAFLSEDSSFDQAAPYQKPQGRKYGDNYSLYGTSAK